MDLDSIIFVDNLPKLDLHGFDRETARVMVLDFIKDNIKMKNEIINIVHGHGSGILKDTVHDTLRKNRNVIEFKTFYNNDGCTIVKIKI
jgi:DNA-nicking Smr family endonuclease